MKILCWNIKGISNDDSREDLRDICRKESPDIICISKPMMNPVDFPKRLLDSLNLHLLCFNVRNNIYKIWIMVSYYFSNITVGLNSD